MASWTVAHQAPLSVECSRQEYRSGLPFLSLGGLPNPGIEPGSPAFQADSLPSELPGMPREGVDKLFSGKSQLVNIFAFADHKVSIATT